MKIRDNKKTFFPLKAEGYRGVANFTIDGGGYSFPWYEMDLEWHNYTFIKDEKNIRFIIKKQDEVVFDRIFEDTEIRNFVVCIYTGQIFHSEFIQPYEDSYIGTYSEYELLYELPKGSEITLKMKTGLDIFQRYDD